MKFSSLKSFTRATAYSVTAAGFILYAYSGHCGMACQSDAADLKKLTDDFTRNRKLKDDMVLVDQWSDNDDRIIVPEVYELNGQYYTSAPALG